MSALTPCACLYRCVQQIDKGGADRAGCAYHQRVKLVAKAAHHGVLRVHVDSRKPPKRRRRIVQCSNREGQGRSCSSVSPMRSSWGASGAALSLVSLMQKKSSLPKRAHSSPNCSAASAAPLDR